MTDRRCHGAVRHIHRRSYVYVSGAAQHRGAATRAKFSKTKRNSKLRKELRVNEPKSECLIDSAEFFNRTDQVGDGGFGHITAGAPKARDRDIRNRPAPTK